MLIAAQLNFLPRDIGGPHAQHKIGRILNGDPDYQDSWTDIIGYTRLVEVDLIERAKPNVVDVKSALTALTKKR